LIPCPFRRSHAHVIQIDAGFSSVCRRTYWMGVLEPYARRSVHVSWLRVQLEPGTIPADCWYLEVHTYLDCLLVERHGSKPMETVGSDELTISTECEGR
jgi:hypothetical protein